MVGVNEKIEKAGGIIKKAKRITVFTGAGISVESGIPPFRGENGLWTKYNPEFLEINHFIENPEDSWLLIREIFYDFFGAAKPNAAHIALAKMEEEKFLKTIITQNIDNLHQEAGNTRVYEYHGTSKQLVCLNCNSYFDSSEIKLDNLPPFCKKCGGLLKPDFVFFGEPIPPKVQSHSIAEAQESDVFILIGTTGEIMPASAIPYLAKENGAKIIEVNISNSNYTKSIVDIFLKGKATVIMKALTRELGI
jgi:NAD-dependent deacetylase